MYKYLVVILVMVLLSGCVEPICINEKTTYKRLATYEFNGQHRIDARPNPETSSYPMITVGYILATPESNTTTLYRVHSMYGSEDVLSTSLVEIGQLERTGCWKYAGELGYIYKNMQANTTALYGLDLERGGHGDHIYTADMDYVKYLESIGYHRMGIIGYIVPVK
jgi:hypothetical protein